MFEMTLIEAMLMWASSLCPWLSEQGIVARWGRSADDVLRRSAWVTISHGDKEAELLLWESGEAEFGCTGADGETINEHYEVASIADLGPILSKLIMSLN